MIISKINKVEENLQGLKRNASFLILTLTRQEVIENILQCLFRMDGLKGNIFLEIKDQYNFWIEAVVPSPLSEEDAIQWKKVVSIVEDYDWVIVRSKHTDDFIIRPHNIPVK